VLMALIGVAAMAIVPFVIVAGAAVMLHHL
jgi:hypothetical protein